MPLDFLKIPDRMEDIGENLYHKILNRIERTDMKLRQGLKDLPETPAVNHLIKEVKETSFSIATVSGQSGGKSTLANAILGYPIFPTANTATTACATKVRYGKPAVKIIYKKPGNKNNSKLLISAASKISTGLWKHLKAYACLCISEEIILAETLQYFSDKDLTHENPEEQDLNMSSENPYHVLQLLLILFSTYVGQNNSKPSEKEKRVCKRRAELFEEFKMSPDVNYSLTVFLENDALKKGLVLIDLPGFGAIAGDKTLGEGITLKGHDKISLAYMQHADMVFVLFDPTAMAGSIPTVLKTLINNERMRYVIAKENRIIPVLNKVDLPGTSIATSTTSIRTIFIDQELQVPYIFPISAIAGEYRFVLNGLCPVRRTLMYQWNKTKWSEQARMMFGTDPTAEQIEAGLEKKLEAGYHQMYVFKGLDGGSYEISLDEFIQMITSGYLERMRCLKELELLNAGLSGSCLLSDNIKSRINILKIMQSGGKQLATIMIRELRNTVHQSMVDFNMAFNKMQDEIKKECEDYLTRKIPSVKKSYTDALDQIEKDIASLIRIEINKMSTNFFGNIVINEADTYTSDGAARARKNKKLYEDLLKSLQNFPVTNRLKKSEDKMTEMIHQIHTFYQDRICQMKEQYQSLRNTIENSLNNEYEQTVRTLLLENHELTREQFDRVYAPIFHKLEHLIGRQTGNFSDSTAKNLGKDGRMKKCQTEAIDSASNYALFLQTTYNTAAEKYIKNAEYQTLADSNAFNRDGVLKSVDQPFFTVEQRGILASEVTGIFATYENDVTDSITRIKNDYTEINTSGLLDSVNGLSKWIKNLIGHGRLDIDSQIADLVKWQEYIQKQMGDLMREINTSLEGLKNCPWAEREIDEARNSYHMLEKLGGE